MAQSETKPPMIDVAKIGEMQASICRFINEQTAKMTLGERIRFEVDSEIQTDLMIYGHVDMSPDAVNARVNRAFNAAIEATTQQPENPNA